MRILFYFMLAGTVGGLTGTLLTGGFTMPNQAALVSILGFMLCATFAQFTLTRAFSRGNLVLSGALQYTVVLFSTILGEIVFGEPATFAIVCGMVLIVVAGISASYFTRQENQLAHSVKKATTPGHAEAHQRHMDAREAGK